MGSVDSYMDANIKVRESVASRSEGFPRTGYFIPGCDGTGAWQISGVVRVTARACFATFPTWARPGLGPGPAWARAWLGPGPGLGPGPAWARPGLGPGPDWARPGLAAPGRRN